MSLLLYFLVFYLLVVAVGGGVTVVAGTDLAPAVDEVYLAPDFAVAALLTGLEVLIAPVVEVDEPGGNIPVNLVVEVKLVVSAGTKPFLRDLFISIFLPLS